MGDTPVATMRPTTCGLGIFYIHTDHLNTPRLITRRSTADIVWRWDSSPFGETEPNQNPSGFGTFVFNLRFPGQYHDPESGLNYNRFRDYDAAVGRYVESDPIGLNGGLSTYSYGSANPISHFDPLGLDCTSAGGMTTCNYPGGPSFTIPTPSGFPAYLGSNGLANFFLYHSYDVRRSLGCADPATVMQALINSPTPGTSNPATPGGAPNNANVFNLFKNPVTSYLTQDTSTGAPVVVNITQAGGALSPGYVARTVTNGVAHSYGEGLDPAQSPWLTGLGANYAAEQLLWGNQMQQMINSAKSSSSSCGCSK